MKKLSLYGPVAVLFLIIGSIIYMANMGLNKGIFAWLLLVPYGDKLGHVFLYGSLTALLQIALQFKTQAWLSFKVQVAAIWVLSFAFIEELSQLFLVNRTFDWWDIASDVIGVSLSGMIIKRKNLTHC